MNAFQVCARTRWRKWRQAADQQVLEDEYGARVVMVVVGEKAGSGKRVRVSEEVKSMQAACARRHGRLLTKLSRRSIAFARSVLRACAVLASH